MTERAHSSIGDLKRAGGLAALFLIALAAVFAVVAWEREKAAQMHRLSEIAQLAASALDLYLGRVETQLRDFSLDLDRGRGRMDAAQARAARFDGAPAELRGLAVVAADGALPAAAPDHDAARCGVAQPHGMHLAIGRAVLAGAGGEWSIALAYAARDGRGRARYLICASLPLPLGAWSGIALGDGVALGLRRDDAYLLAAHPPPAGAALEQAYARPQRGVLAELLQQPDAPAAGAIEGADASGEGARLWAYRRLAHYPLTLDASMPASTLYAAWWDRVRLPLVFLALLLAGGALLYKRMRRDRLARDAERAHARRDARTRSRALAQRVEELEATRLELESFSHCLAHDLRTPLRGIDGFAYQLRKDYGEQLGEAGRAHLDRIRAASRRLSGTMDQLLKLSEIDLQAFKRETVDLSALAREVIAGLEAGAPRPGLTWVIAQGLRAQGDVRLLRVVLQNLLDNALKFSAGRAASRIEFGVWPEPRGGQQTFFVKDDGVGFDMKRAGRLFRAFERLHGRDEFPGHGIGLALVQRVVRRHGGQLWAEGARGQGAMFYFTLG